ncbi:septum formation protein [Schaalia georgiae]|nr:septum formation protein [Schaalia georgiae]
MSITTPALQRNRRPLSAPLRALATCAAAASLSAMALAGCATSSVMHMTIGQCIQQPENDQVSTVETVDCSKPHDAEVFFLHKLEGSDYPGQDSLTSTAEQVCVAAFQGYVGTSYEESSLDVTWFLPTTQSWAQNDHEIVCMVADMQGRKLNQSAKNSGL